LSWKPFLFTHCLFKSEKRETDLFIPHQLFFDANGGSLSWLVLTFMRLTLLRLRLWYQEPQEFFSCELSTPSSFVFCHFPWNFFYWTLF
jgi:hypothetical protein